MSMPSCTCGEAGRTSADGRNNFLLAPATVERRRTSCSWSIPGPRRRSDAGRRFAACAAPRPADRHGLLLGVAGARAQQQRAGAHNVRVGNVVATEQQRTVWARSAFSRGPVARSPACSAPTCSRATMSRSMPRPPHGAVSGQQLQGLRPVARRGDQHPGRRDPAWPAFRRRRDRRTAGARAARHRRACEPPHSPRCPFARRRRPNAAAPTRSGPARASG